MYLPTYLPNMPPFKFGLVDNGFGGGCSKHCDKARSRHGLSGLSHDNLYPSAVSIATWYIS